MVSGAWNRVSLPTVSLGAGTRYWIALLGTGGTLKFRDRCCGGGANVEASSQSTLTTLPASWTTGATYKDGPASAYVAGSGAVVVAASGATGSLAVGVVGREATTWVVP